MYYYKYNGPKYLDNQKIKKIIVVPSEDTQGNVQGIITINDINIQFNEIKTIQTGEGMYITSIGKLNNEDIYSEIEIISELEI